MGKERSINPRNGRVRLPLLFSEAQDQGFTIHTDFDAFTAAVKANPPIFGRQRLIVDRGIYGVHRQAPAAGEEAYEIAVAAGDNILLLPHVRHKQGPGDRIEYKATAALLAGFIQDDIGREVSLRIFNNGQVVSKVFGRRFARSREIALSHTDQLQWTEDPFEISAEDLAAWNPAKEATSDIIDTWRRRLLRIS